jgi:hypothetical protein
VVAVDDVDLEHRGDVVVESSATRRASSRNIAHASGSAARIRFSTFTATWRSNWPGPTRRAR